MLSVGSGAPVFIAEYEKSTTIDLASSEDLEGMKVDNVSPLGHGVVVQERFYLLPRQVDEKVKKFTFRHSARSSTSLTENNLIC